MLHGNSVKLLTGMFPFYPIVSILTPWQGNSHPELAAAVAER